MRFSFRTPTYARISLLQEMLFSFLNLDYDENEVEMVIVNDYPLQELIFDHPRVKIFNLKETFPIIGMKENFTIENCSGNIIITADDDDIALSNHLKNIDKYWAEGTDIIFWKNAAYYNEPNITALTSVGNSGMVFSKKAWEKVGKSPIEQSGGDMTFANKLRSTGISVYADPPDKEISWFYRWSLPIDGGCYHSSGNGTDTPDKPNIVQRHSAHIELQRKLGKIPTGRIQLVPQWRHNYSQMLKDFINK